MKRIVLKVGSSVLTEYDQIALERMRNLVSLIAELKEHYEVILVSSGAVAAGNTIIKLQKGVIANKALASIGQPLLMSHYKKKFHHYNIPISQLLVTRDEFDSRSHTHVARETVDMLLANGIVPIVNENDAMVIGDAVVGDNDQLSALVTHYFNADLLVILSDIDGYYDDNPRENPEAKRLKEVRTIPESELQQAHSPNHAFATGGIVTKLKAADFLLKRGKKMFLSSGFELNVARAFLLEGTHTKGTLFSVD